MRARLKAMVLATLLCRAGIVCAAVWDGESVDNNWSNPTNWTGDTVPQAGDNVVFDSTSTKDCTVDITPPAVSSLKLLSGYTGTVTFQNLDNDQADTVTIAGDLVVSNGTVVFQGETAGAGANGAGFIIEATNVTIGSGGNINADYQGFPKKQGPGKGNGAPWDGSGAGYGGEGGDHKSYAGGSIYGSESGPTALGSGGHVDSSSGASGGGAIKLVVSDTTTIDGTLSADGQSPSHSNDRGAGSGGSIWIASGTLSGTGTISADGGNGMGGGGGGGGGRIDVSGVTYNYAGAMTTSGGSPGGGFAKNRFGEPGTILFPAGADITVEDSIVFGNSFTFGDLTVSNGANLALYGNTITADTVTVKGTITCDGNGRSTYGTGVTIVATDMTVTSGASVSASYRGFGKNEGPGKGNGAPWDGSGAGYGGEGGDDGAYSGGSPYGSAYEPDELGSGGHGDASSGASGGGAIKLVISGTLTIDGSVKSDGQTPSHGNDRGGGSGGAIWIDCGTLLGGGTLKAGGGNGVGGGGDGGGGRIAVYYVQKSGTLADSLGSDRLDEDNGDFCPHGPGGDGGAGNGTLYVQTKMPAPPPAGPIFRWK